MTLDEFIACIDTSGVMNADEVRATIDALPPEKRPADANGLAVLLLNQNLLTKYQAELLTSGHTKGLVLGNYLLLERLGKGGMGEVFKAVHRRMERIVAIKVVNESTAMFPESLERFHREVKAAARLTHPNIVTAYDADEAAGVHFLVLEYVEGTDLDQLVRAHGGLTPAQSIQVVIQAARGLEYAHSKGIVHRDIKPANLIIDSDGVVRILDMGLARLQESATTDGGFTQSHSVFGSLDYMPPEQAESAKKADERSDIYSLGCTLYTLATGDVPYDGESTIQKFLAHREDPIPSLIAAAPDIPPDLDAVFRRMVAKAPDERFQTMTQVIAELEALATPGDSELLVAAKAASQLEIDPYASTMQRQKPGTSASQRAKTMPVVQTPNAPPVGNFDTGYVSPSAAESDTASTMDAGTVVHAPRVPSAAPTAARELDDQWMEDVDAATASQVVGKRQPEGISPQLLMIGGGIGLVAFIGALVVVSMQSGNDPPKPQLAKEPSPAVEQPPIPKVDVESEPDVRPPPVKVPPEVEPKPDPDKKPPPVVEPKSNAINLLASVDLKRDTYGRNQWTRQDGALVSVAQRAGPGPPRPEDGVLLQIATQPPTAYELNIIVEDLPAPGPFVIGIPSGQHWAMIMLDRSHPRGPPGPGAPPKGFGKKHRPRTADFVVTGNNSLKITVRENGRAVECNSKKFQYESHLALDPLYRGLTTGAKPGRILLGAVGEYKITKLELIPAE